MPNRLPRLLVLPLIGLLAALDPAQAQVKWPQAVASLEDVDYAFVDGVTDGCLPSPNATEQAVWQKLAGAGLSRSTEAPKLTVIFEGYETSVEGFCVATLELRVDALVPINNQPVPMNLYESKGLMSGPKANFQERATQAAGRLADAFVTNYQGVRQAVAEALAEQEQQGQAPADDAGASASD